MFRKLSGLLLAAASFVGLSHNAPTPAPGAQSVRATSSPSTQKGASQSAQQQSAAAQRAERRVFGSGYMNRYSGGVIPPFHRVKGKTRAVLRPSL
jgi:hypothetical protein